MSIKLNRDALEHAKELITAGEVEKLKKWNWQEHKPNRDDIVRFLDTHYTKGEYGQWFLGIDTEIDADNKDRYLFPYGDLQIVHRNGIQAAYDAAKKEGYDDIARAAKDLLDIIDNKVN